MTSWRDTLSEQAQDDVDGLVRDALEFARQLQAKRGEFFPFGFVRDHAGQVRPLAAAPGAGEFPTSSSVLTLLWETVLAEAAALRCCAIAADVTLREEGTEAIRVEVEHLEGIALTVYLPYTANPAIRYGTINVIAGERRVWP